MVKKMIEEVNPAPIYGVQQFSEWLPYVALGTVIFVAFLILLSPSLEQQNLNEALEGLEWI
jgi:hypothetical protein